MIPHFARTASSVQSLVVAVLPHGGQRSARRNAWASMSEGNSRAKARREAESAMTRAISMSQHPAASAR
ncbi:MAG: hypothetical protein JWM02_3336 [Frankiales bacterium]|nr:hypothetical protein [Frankiales bacterium]